MEQIFTYGTLGEPAVQKKIFGRIIESKKDVLEGYEMSKIKIENIYPIIVEKADSSIEGLVISVTSRELKLADIYETKEYQREKLVLKSGKKAWVYIMPRNIE